MSWLGIALMTSGGSQGQPAAPRLESQRSANGQVIVSWSETAIPAILEQTSALGPAASWSPVSETSTLQNGVRSVAVTPNAGPRFFRLRSSAPAVTRILDTSPTDGSTRVAVTRETVFRFETPLSSDSVLDDDALFAEFAGRRLLARAELSSDRRTATLFYLENLPSNARIRVTLVGDLLRDENGVALDADGDGLASGIRTLSFDTLGSQSLPGTAIIGKVFASEKNPDGSNRPLVNVTITVDGAEETLRTVTDATGAFSLQPSPSGRFFVHVDGRTAIGSQWPNGAYYPFVGKAWEALAGRTNNLAGGSGEIFLPLVPADALAAVSATESTRVTFSPTILAAQPSLAGVQIDVPANSLFSDNGTRGGRVGLAPVAPDRLPEPLPPGLNIPLVITIQTDGAANFDQPVPVRFPNLPDPVTGVRLGPGEKTALWSFVHDTGRWEIQGSMTISADGNFAISDPGVGVRQPGWHGPAPGSGGRGPRRGPSPGPDPDPPKDPPEPCYDPCDIKALNYVACWDGYYERYLKNPGPTDPDERKKWEQDKAEKYAECGDKLDDLMECREAAGGPCGSPASPSTASWVPGDLPAAGSRDSVRQTAAPTPTRTLEQILTAGIELTELEQSYEDQRIPWAGAGDAFLVAPMQTTGLAQRGVLNEQGNLENLILLPNQYYLAAYFNHARTEFGIAIFRSAASGQITLVPAARLLPGPLTQFPDQDADGLPDLAENILGTDVANPDTDGDGASDGLESRSGSNPLDGIAIQPGVIAVASTSGNAFDLGVENDVAAVLQANKTLALFDVKNPRRPVLLASVALPGNPVRMGFHWPLVAVVQFGNSTLDFTGVTVVDVRNPSLPVVLWNRTLPVKSTAGVAMGYGRVFVSSDAAGVHVLSETDGSTIGILNGGGHDLRIVGDRLDILTGAGIISSRLTCTRLIPNQPIPTVLGSIEVPGQPASGNLPTRLFSESDTVYVGTGAGYRVVDVRDPQNPVLLPGAVFNAGRIQDLGKDSENLLLANTSFSGPSTLQVSFFDTSVPSNNTNRILLLETPGDPTSLELYSGHAFVADSSFGLAVLDYRALEIGTNAPTVAVMMFPTQSTPVQHEGGTPLHVSVRARDNVAVRDVEIYLGDTFILKVGSHPFEADIPTPIFRSSQSDIVLRARATDLAGNSTWSVLLTVPLIPDETPPRVASTQPAPGFVVKAGTSPLWTAHFSEPMTTSTLSSSTVFIVAPGADGQIGTADDTAVSGVPVTLGEDDATISLTIPAALAAGPHRIVVRGTVTDSNALPMGNDFVWPFEVRAPIVWNVAADGLWSAPGHWNPARLPGTNDFVIIDRPEGVFTVTLDFDNGTQPSEVLLQSLQSAEPFRFQGSPNQPQFLGVAQGAEFLAPVVFANSVFLRGGPWSFSGGIEILPQRILEIGQLAETFGPPGLVTIGSAGATSRIEDGILRPLAGATVNHRAESTMELRAATDGAGYNYIDAANQFTGPSTVFVNEGRLTKTGPGAFTIGVPVFHNRGEISVDSGKLVLQAPFGQVGEIVHDGVLKIAAGTTVEFQALLQSPFSVGRLARIEGLGTINFAANTTFLGPYEFAGETRIQQSARFADRVRSSGQWFSRQDLEFAGLSVELTGPVEFNGGQVRFNQATETVLPAVQITRDTTLAGRRGATFSQPLTLEAGRLVLQTPIRFAAPVSIRNHLSAFHEAGSAEFTSPTPTIWEQGDVNLSGAPSRIAPGAVFEARGGGTFSARGFRNEGTFRKTADSTITLALLRSTTGEVSFLNAGLLEVTGGAVEANTERGTFRNEGTARFAGGRWVLRTTYEQTQGSTLLTGGTLATRQNINVQGGVFGGTGTVVAPDVVIHTSATLDPGAPLGVLLITNQLGSETLGAGALTFDVGSRLLVDIGGRTAGTEFDQVHAVGDARLNGKLEVRLANNFAPTLGDEFLILTARSRRNSQFTETQLPVLGAGRKLEVLYETNAVKLRVVAGP